MSANDIQNSPTWKKPNEVMQLHRLKMKKRALQNRMCQPSQSCPASTKAYGKPNNSFNLSRILGSEKRKNPFSKNSLEKDDKVFCNGTDTSASLLDESTDSTLFKILGIPDNKQTQPEQPIQTDATLASFTNILNNLIKKDNAEEIIQDAVEGKHYVPIDWSLKSRIRLMSPNAFAWNQKLKASEEASGITGFVRCLDTSNSSTLDTSHHARFHQNCLYWQHPSLPWMNLFPRTSGRVSNKNFIAANDEIKNALHQEWTESFRSLFQLLRVRQCPYFYVCANTFTCLFRAAGIGGIAETCAFVAPTTRGFRQTLKQEEIEFTMPLKKQEGKRKSDAKDDGDAPKNSSTDSCYDTMDNDNADRNTKSDNLNDEDEDDDDMESDEWLQSLGVAADEIKKINNSQIRLNQVAESSVDSSAESMICVQGVDAQALFNFLLNCKSSIAVTGTFGGIPPTLLSPTSFQGGTLKCLKVRESMVHSEGGKYFSVELKGPILPTTVHSLCSLLQSNSNPFSGTFANSQHTVAFSKAARLTTDDEKCKENASGKAPSVFGRENLSDCGLNANLLEHFCSSDPSVVETIDSLKYCSDKKTYMWS
ncbi:humpty dumpty [Arctopsyche grandis]|uniref:humpty dumpty n=1 Tax=Arctopsyche grandis TaxID=121162 RepID=UPI00406DA17D